MFLPPSMAYELAKQRNAEDIRRAEKHRRKVVARMKTSHWIIEVSPDGKLDITRDRKSFAYDLDDYDEAFARIKRDRRYQAGDRVEVIEPDGYRRRITSL
jgi:hypothetical protein